MELDLDRESGEDGRENRKTRAKKFSIKNIHDITLKRAWNI